MTTILYPTGMTFSGPAPSEPFIEAGETGTDSVTYRLPIIIIK